MSYLVTFLALGADGLSVAPFPAVAGAADCAISEGLLGAPLLPFGGEGEGEEGGGGRARSGVLLLPLLTLFAALLAAVETVCAAEVAADPAAEAAALAEE